MESIKKREFQRMGLLIGLAVVVGILVIGIFNIQTDSQHDQQENNTESDIIIHETKNGTMVQEVKKGPRDYAYTLNYDADTVSVVDLEKKKIEATIDVGDGPVEATLHEGRIFVANQKGKNISVINPKTNEVEETIALNVEPRDLLFVKDTIYITDQDHTVYATNKDSKLTIPIIVSDQPTYLFFDEVHNVVYATCASANTVAMINPDINGFMGDLKVESFPQGITGKSTAEYVYVANQDSDSISIIATKLKEKVREIPAGIEPQRLTITGDDSYIYATMKTSEIGVIGTKKEELLYTIPVDTPGYGMAFSTDQSKLYVTHPKSNELSIIDRDQKEVIAKIKVGKTPRDLIIIRK